MRNTILILAILAAPAAADGPATTPGALGAHVACFVGKESTPILKRRAITKDVTCQIEIDQGEPPPSAKAQIALTQDGQVGAVHNSEQFVPHDKGDGVYYPFPDTFKPGTDFKACKDFDIKARIVDGDKELWRGSAPIPIACKAPKKLPLQFSCHWDGDLVCVLQTKDLKTKIPAGDVGRVKLGGTTKVVQDAFADYPDDTYAVEARFAKADVPCSGASIEAVAENPQGQAVYASTITAPSCP
jgi:hypothetical protein